MVNPSTEVSSFYAEYQRMAKLSKPTAIRDLTDLVKRKILKFSGTPGAGTFYKIIGSPFCIHATKNELIP